MCSGGGRPDPPHPACPADTAAGPPPKTSRWSGYRFHERDPLWFEGARPPLARPSLAHLCSAPSAPPARPPTRDLSPQCARLFAVSHHRCPEFKRPPLSALPLPCARADGVQLVVRNGDVGGPVPYGNAKCYNLNMKGGLQLLQPPLRSILKL